MQFLRVVSGGSRALPGDLEHGGTVVEVGEEPGEFLSAVSGSKGSADVLE